MIRLSARIAVGGGTEAIVRLAVMAAGTAVGVAMLLFGTVVAPALHAHDVRAAWLRTSPLDVRPEGRPADPALWRRSDDRYLDRPIVRVDVAALGAAPPLPPGLSRLPGPGELAVSPAMARLLATTPAPLLGARFPGAVTQIIGDLALRGPDDLVVVAGHDAAELRSYPGVERVTAIEAEPEDHGSTGLLAVVIAVGVTGLVLPVLVFVSMVTRLAAARRERRFAAMRLAGATPGQIGVVAAVEAGAAAVTGTAGGFAAFHLLRPVVAGFPLDGWSFFPSDLAPAAPYAALVGAGVPALAAATAMVSLRRVRISPLGVSRRAVAPRPGRRRLFLLPAGLAAFVPAVLVSLHSDSPGAVAGVVLAFAAIVAGIVAAGPSLTAAVGRALGRTRGPAGLLAGRRLQADPSAGFRAVSGLVLAVFTATVISGVLPAMGGSAGKARALPGDLVAMALTDRDGAVAAPPRAADAIAAAAGRTGRVVELRVPAGAAARWRGKANTALSTVYARCGDLLALRMASCSEPAAIVAADASYLGEGLFAGTARPPSPPVGPAELAAMRVAAVAVATDGRPATIERARTAMEAAYPAARSTPATAAEARADANPHLVNLERLSDAGLSLALLVAACSLATAVTGGLIERRRPLALLRLAGVRVGCLARMTLAETALPLLVVAGVSAALGLVVSALLLGLSAGTPPWRPPGGAYWLSLAGGLTVAVAVTAVPLTLLRRLTSPESARYE
ncbi:FtsX-like permease family protein [Microbispora sp. ATCC PTA-5024]|uniref:FtsX-like permease family protein n=1 Tax=Microbispora sp. ATCC PTA-5024 TaxID=316330 RepID=UPI0003DD1444|nr:FtsX-like permease family protein [Microbispora sp. ATCC PTA-5024]ETK31643.1 ABC transporter permease [Microbispora sp. ATCC PTA-5024]